MTRSYRLIFCIAGTLGTGCALPGITADYDTGATGVGGAGGGSSHTGGKGQGGGSANAGASNPGGMSNVGGLSNAGGGTAAGGSSQLGGTGNGGGSAVVGGASSAGGSTLTGGVGNAAGATTTGGVPGTGGLPNSGGNKPTGGASTTVGGATGTGGASNAGGTTGTGGSLNNGGSKPTGGATSTGGTAAGGAKPTGGTTSTGGTLATGGATATGGAKPTGGASATGGAAPTGGAMPTGGTTSTGGNVATGGATSTTMVATAIAAGLGHSCALVSGGAVWCWGNNYHGELGNQAPYGVDPNTIDSSVVPVQVLNINQASSIATGSYHSCAALTTGTGKCWGWSNYGQLGNGTAGTNSRSNVPVVVAGITNAAAMVAGLYHTCALLLDHTVKCWGSNSNGQLGGGNWNDSAVPVTVVTDASSLSPLSQVSALASGKNHVCAVQTSGTVYCWGSNGSGELGRGTAADSDIAAQALGIQASSVGAGESHSCAVTTTGAVQCWGYNYYGALGDNTTNDSLAPVTSKTSSPTAITLGLGANHSCAVLNNASGNVQCWGRNEYGQLGIGSQANSSVPQNVYGLTQATTASGGDWHTCAIVGGGAVYCWGDNTFGQLGDGNGQDGALSTVPTRVHGF